MSTQVETVGVVGLGTMGAGIVEVMARSGRQVVGVDVDDAAVQRGRDTVQRSLERALSKGRLTPDDRDAVLSRMRWGTSTAELAVCDLVVEAAPEQLPIKRDVVARVDAAVRPDAVVATNTSSLSVTQIAAASAVPARVVGMHFFNPPTVLRLVEVVRTPVSDPAVVAAIADLARDLGKHPVVIDDRAGFIANALLLAYLNHAVRLLEGHVATRDEIDTAMREGSGLPMGPFALLDLIGLDTSLAIVETMYAETGLAHHVPSPLLRRLVALGRLGRKSGRGFYTYDKPWSGAVVADPAGAEGTVRVAGEPETVHDRLTYAGLADAARMIESGYASGSDVDTAMTSGCGYPEGPATTIRRLGESAVVARLSELQAEYGEEVYRPTRLLRRQAAALESDGAQAGR